MRIDISAELLEIDNETYYSDWSIAEVRTDDERTEVELAVSASFDDVEYLDFTPVFDILQEASKTVGDKFFITEIQFNPHQVVGTIVLTSEDIRTEGSVEYPITVTRKTGKFHILDTSELEKIDYENSPLIVGYCDRPSRLAIESR